MAGNINPQEHNTGTLNPKRKSLERSMVWVTEAEHIFLGVVKGQKVWAWSAHPQQGCIHKDRCFLSAILDASSKQKPVMYPPCDFTRY